jgi:hypothetical protein
LATGAFRNKPASGHEFAHLCAVAIGASRCFLAKDKFFKLATTAFALIFKNRHMHKLLRNQELSYLLNELSLVGVMSNSISYIIGGEKSSRIDRKFNYPAQQLP